ncbi:SDR family NAD(P)-dependent oxidoreductase [Chryseosolibacter indicus]|uniref:SDR family oxidoreductase n=1 Tax=Chryseosolibacter indicus TaxID=2782351 RepID=A0ABS5W008_9BACT|nr:SDR family oxidoreductase [Chryseosolibacter indicus]MBT1705616.1 SDR family oxidoreductase [Chryseosolibacter indicus]
MNVTLITGASGGIGEALATKFAERKHNLLLIARSADKLEKQCVQLETSFGIKAQYIAVDLNETGAANLVFEECQKRKLYVRVLVNNAGVGSSGEFFKNDLESELKIIQLNNVALVSLCRLFLPGMIQRGNGSIINVASVAAFFPSPYMTVYSASKFFVRSFTQALTEECRPYGVHVLLVSPGLTETNFMETPANANQWGKVLVEGANMQTSEQVAEETIRAWEKGKTFHVAGRLNRIGTKVGALMPYATIAKLFAQHKRKKMNL